MNLLSSPTVQYCESATNFIISRPGYALSNLPYIAIGVYFLSKNRKLGKYFGAFLTLIGVASFLYDATYTLLSQLIDLSAMFLFINFLVFLNLRRITFFKQRNYEIVSYLSLFFAFLALTFAIGGSTGRILFGISVLFLIISELYIYFVSRNYSIKLWLFSFFVFILGFGIWLLDANQIWCDPNNIFNGRSIFHYTTAIAIVIVFKHYLQFEEKLNLK